MIRAGELKATIASALHLPAKRVDYPYRVLVEGGEVSKGKRGLGGAAVNEGDAAKALIAVASSYMGGEVIQGIRNFSGLTLADIAHNNFTASFPSEPAGAVKNYSEEGWTEIEGGPFVLLDSKIPQLQLLPPRHTFAEALTALITAARDRAFKSSHRIEVIFYGPEPKVGIEIELWLGDNRYYVEQAVYLLPNRRDGIEAANAAAAFEITVKIDQQPIYAVADLFRYHGCDLQGYPLDPKHPGNLEGTNHQIAARRAEIEAYIDERGFDK